MNPSSYFESMGGGGRGILAGQEPGERKQTRKKTAKENALQKKFAGGKNQEVGRRRMPGD